jgi:hypothetical protein
LQLEKAFDKAFDDYLLSNTRIVVKYFEISAYHFTFLIKRRKASVYATGKNPHMSTSKA